MDSAALAQKLARVLAYNDEIDNADSVTSGSEMSIETINRLTGPCGWSRMDPGKLTFVETTHAGEVWSVTYGLYTHFTQNVTYGPRPEPSEANEANDTKIRWILPCGHKCTKPPHARYSALRAESLESGE